MPSDAPVGELGVLAVGLGDLTLRFDKESPTEAANAKQTITGLLRQGYAILVEMPDGSHARATEFDPARDVYIIPPTT